MSSDRREDRERKRERERERCVCVERFEKETLKNKRQKLLVKELN